VHASSIVRSDAFRSETTEHRNTAERYVAYDLPVPCTLSNPRGKLRFRLPRLKVMRRS